MISEGNCPSLDYRDDCHNRRVLSVSPLLERETSEGCTTLLGGGFLPQKSSRASIVRNAVLGKMAEQWRNGGSLFSTAAWGEEAGACFFIALSFALHHNYFAVSSTVNILNSTAVSSIAESAHCEALWSPLSGPQNTFGLSTLRKTPAGRAEPSVIWLEWFIHCRLDACVSCRIRKSPTHRATHSLFVLVRDRRPETNGDAEVKPE